MHRPHRFLAAVALGLLVLTLSGCNPSSDAAESVAFRTVYGGAGSCRTTSEGQATSGGRSYRQYRGSCGVNGQQAYLFTSYYSLNGVPQPSGQPVDQAHVSFDQNVPHTGPVWFGCGGADLSKDQVGNWRVVAIFLC